MGMIAFRRLREQQAAAKAAASFSTAEPTLKLEQEQPAPKRRRSVKRKPEQVDGHCP